MNTNRFKQLSRFVLAAGLVAAAAGSAHAGGNGVYWSVNVATPVGVSTSISNTRHGVYGGAPVVYAPAPVVYAPPVYMEPRPVYVQPRPVYVPAPVAYEAPRFCPPRWGWHHHHHGYARGDDRYAWNDGGDRMVPRGGYDRDDGGRGGWRRDR